MAIKIDICNFVDRISMITGNIYLIGYMASGKTTFGQALSDFTGRTFVDLDREIEKAHARPLHDLIAEKGFEWFRLEERDTLKRVSSLKNAVIACGGGTPCYFDNMDFMNRNGTAVWLTATPERIAERVSEALPTRPLLKDIAHENLTDHIRKHLAERTPFYEKAALSFSGEHLENASQISESVEKFIKSFLQPPTQ